MSARPKILIKQEDIYDAIDRMAEEIRRDYRGKNPLLIGILKGSFIFMADLVRCIGMRLEVDFIRLSSYGSGTQSSGKIKVLTKLTEKVRGRHVIVVEDIIDTGLTTTFLMDFLKKKGAASVKLCALTEKPSRRKINVPIDYLGFSIPDKFIVGYGIDWGEKYRYLPDIRYIE
jgi:hypoxanthine phosphoribosyltransferase